MLRTSLAVVLSAVGLAVAAGADTYVWVDAEGTTHVTDDPSGIPEGTPRHRGEDKQALRGLWGDGLGPSAPPAGARDTTSREDARASRLIRGAIDDLQRGETARATAALQSVLRLAPGRPEAHWYLALLDRQRGRYESSERHLRAFLAAAGDDLEPWRVSAKRRLAALADERRLAAGASGSGPARWVDLSHETARGVASACEGAIGSFPATGNAAGEGFGGA